MKAQFGCDDITKEPSIRTKSKHEPLRQFSSMGQKKPERATQDCLGPVDRELCLQKELEEVETQREQASREIKHLKKMS
jgi:hypothetical protein